VQRSRRLDYGEWDGDGDGVGIAELEEVDGIGAWTEKDLEDVGSWLAEEFSRLSKRSLKHRFDRGWA